MPPLSGLVHVTASDAVVLGERIACDGFSKRCSARVQTHSHDDHLKDFNSSKKTQQIFLTRETRELMSTRRKYFGLRLQCSNIHEIEPGTSFEYESHVISVHHSNHMLGGVQVSVLMPNGCRAGYSSDFDWPLDEIISVDALVVDSTAGHPNKILQYSQGEAEESLLNLTEENIRYGPVDIVGSQRGIVQRAMSLLSPMFPDYAFICSGSLEQENEVYRASGYTIKPTIEVCSEEGRKLLNKGGRYIRFRGRADKKSIGGDRKTKITLSPFPSPGETPVTVWRSSWPEKCYSVGLYDHADFEGTIEYIRNTGAQYVLTDSRGQYAFELAAEIRNRLNIEASHAEQKDSWEWGV